ncbi:MarR family transcriptional regulator [Pantoea agglomerans]|uniref:MarR family transcriptional regulator n=1 Tax=Enterobacter agglomerans TaxID=549 RepID=UPI00026D28DD
MKRQRQTFAHSLTLKVRWGKNSITVSGLSQGLQLDPSTLRHLLKRLEQAGFISRTCKIGQDQRWVIIRLTEASHASES